MTSPVMRPTPLDPACWGPRIAPSTARAAWWAVVSVRRARRSLKVDGLGATVAPPPPLPVGATRGVQVVLHRSPATCLERALVLQTWLAAHGARHDIVIGVDRRGEAVAAHAWLDFEEGTQAVAGFREIHRRVAP